MHPWIEIFGEKIPTYLLWISLTYCFALIYLYKRGQNKGYSKNIILDSALIVMLAGFVGARLFHVFYEEASYYLEDPLRIFYIWQGGFVYYGGALTAYLSLRIWARNKPIDFDQLLDIYAPVIVLGYGIGRFACLFAGCCHGAACDLPWAIVYPPGVEAPTGIPLHPTPIYASLWAFANYALLLFLEKTYSPRTNRKDFLPEGVLFYIAVVTHSFGRLLMEHFRGDHRGADVFGFSISSIISIALIFLATRLIKNKTESK